MQQVHPNLIVGGLEACTHDSGRTILHACKHPCHQWAVGYTGSLPSNHPEYLVARRGNHIFLNLIDANRELLQRFTGHILRAALDFIETHVSTQTVIVHCNRGFSRAPSIAMLYLVKRAHVFRAAGFPDAAQAFRTMYPGYAPGPGLAAYLLHHWDEIS